MSKYLWCCIYLHTFHLVCNCGRRGTPDFDRIMGGTFATNAEYPWAVIIRDCGAALISEQWVVTAAHCVGSDNTIDVWLGVHSLSDNFNEVILRIMRLKASFQRYMFQYIYRESVQVIQHPKYNSTTKSNDIALIKLPQPLDLNARTDIVPICLPPSGSRDSYVGDKAIAIGWGRTSEGSFLGGIDTCKGDIGGELS